MKVCWVAPWFSSLDSVYCQVLADSGYDMLLVASDAHYDQTVKLFEPSIKFSLRSSKWEKIPLMNSLYRAIRKQAPDVVLFDLPQRIPLLLLAFALRRQSKFVLVIHDATPHDKSHEFHPIIRYLQNQLAVSSHGLLTFSNNSKNELLARYPEANVQTAPLLSEVPVAITVSENRVRRNFAMIGRWSDYKGFDIGLECWKAFQDVSETESQLEMWCSGLDEIPESESNVIWRSSKSFLWTDLLEALPNYCGVLMPYRSASQSGVQVLAWDFGVPVLISALPGLIEFQPDCLPAISLGDQESWVQAIAGLEDSSRAESVGIQGSRQLKELRSGPNVLRAFAQCFESLHP